MVRDARLKFTRELSASLTIRSVSADGIRVNDRLWSETIALTPEQYIDSWQSVPLTDLTEDNFSTLLEHGPELVIIGTGV